MIVQVVSGEEYIWNIWSVRISVSTLAFQAGKRGSTPLRSTKYGRVAQLVRALACHARGRRFEPGRGRHTISRKCYVSTSVSKTEGLG